MQWQQEPEEVDPSAAAEARSTEQQDARAKLRAYKAQLRSRMVGPHKPSRNACILCPVQLPRELCNIQAAVTIMHSQANQEHAWLLD